MVESKHDHDPVDLEGLTEKDFENISFEYHLSNFYQRMKAAADVMANGEFIYFFENLLKVKRLLAIEALTLNKMLKAALSKLRSL